MDLECFVEALHDSTTNLTYPALTGAQQQSVLDVERFFSGDMIRFMERKGYIAEAQYLSIVHNWRKACDEQGLSAETRQLFNQEFLQFILDDLMPWHKDKDLSFLEVNR